MDKNISVEEIKEIMKSEVSPNVDVDSLKQEDSWESAGLDSLDRSSVFFALEERTGVQFSDEDVDRIDTINDLNSFLAAS